MAGLTFGPLDLMGEDSDYQIVALSTDEGTTWGNPDTVDVELRSFLQAGALVETENWTNRPLVIAVSVGGDTNDDVALNEKVLVALLHRPGTLAYTPETATVATVFPVLTSTLEPTHEDFRESFDHEVIYQIKMTCAPFVRDADLTFIDAVVPGGDPEDIPVLEVDEDSTGWTAGYSYNTSDPEDPGPADSFDYTTDGVTLSATGYVPYDPYSSLTATFSVALGDVDVTDHHYVYVDWKCSDPMRSHVTGSDAHLGGVLGFVAKAGEIVSPANPDYTRTYFIVPDAVDTVTSLLLELYLSRAVFFVPYPDISVVEVGVSNSLPSLSSRQLVRSLDIDGVMPAPGSIAVVSPDDGLSDVIIYTCVREGAELYLPPCSSYGIEPAISDRVPDASTVTGSKLDFTEFFRQFSIPHTRLPDGEYLLAVIADMSGKDAPGKQISVNAGAFMGGVNIQPGSDPDTGEYLGNVDTSVLYDDDLGGFQFMRLMTLPLPRTRMAKTEEATTRITLGALEGTGTAWLDEVYLFNVETGELTHVDCGEKTRLWIDSPDLGNDGSPGIWIGDQADRSDQFSAFPVTKALDIHQFDPTRGVNVTSVATGPAGSVAVSFGYYRQFWYRVPPKGA